MRPLHLLAAVAVFVVCAVFVTFAALAVATTEAPVTTDALAGPAGSDPGQTCGRVADPDFPIRAELRGGPGAYRAGGAAGEWSLDLTNTTGAECRNIHPVVVLYDRDRVLDVSQVRLEMADDRGRLRVLPLERTDQDEIVAVRDDGSPGFTVAAHRTVTVRARLAFTASARPNRISATVATVQRRGNDGDWVGASHTYRFAIAAPAGAPAASAPASAPATAKASVPASSYASALPSAPVSAPASDSDSDSDSDSPSDSAPFAHRPADFRAPGGPWTGAVPVPRREAAPGLLGFPALAATGTRADLAGRVVAALALGTAGVVLALGIRRVGPGRRP
ncbi:hypothetical protein AB0P17_21115 [Streptomyces sp. NPDC088124]|uniref:hypothetical protein n=1 Tax=Streptomyces sp. NPDC088124 TaxID=3154654 RepID=UPI003412D303